MAGHRWVVLSLTCFSLMCIHFASETHIGLQNKMLKSLTLEPTDIEWLSSMYYLPNIVLIIVAGYLVDQVFGISRAAIGFSLIVLLGQIVFSFGAFIGWRNPGFYLMILGRLIFGVGRESFIIAMMLYILRYFERTRLPLLFGLQVASTRLGSVLSIAASQVIYQMFLVDLETPPVISKLPFNKNPIGWSLLLFSLFCGIAVICTFFLACYDNGHSRERLSPPPSQGSSPRTSRMSMSAEVTEDIRLKDIKDLRLSFWLLALIVKFFSIAYFSFAPLAVIFLKRKYSMVSLNAVIAVSIMYLVPVVGSPLFGYLIGRTGRNVVWILVSVLTLLASHLILCFTPSCQPDIRSPDTFDIVTPWYDAHFPIPWIATSLMGLSYSIFSAAFWPTIAYIIPVHLYGTAQGITLSIQNLGLAWSPFLSGLLILRYGFTASQVFFIFSLCVCLSFVIVLFVVDKEDASPLNLSGRKRKQIPPPMPRPRSIFVNEVNEETPLITYASCSREYGDRDH